jgi:succinyl-CoA synthetase alpha subunit
MVDYRTRVVAGVTPGKGGQGMNRIPVFNTVAEAVKHTSPTVSAIFVPPAFAADAVLEAGEGGIPLIICFTEGIPVLDMITVRSYLDRVGVKLIGPNTPGAISPGKSKVGLMAGYIHKQGNIGVISRSGTLTYEVVYQLTKRGFGQSTCIGIGGDPIVGLSFIDLLEMFETDTETDGVIIIGEIGGVAEEEAAEFVKCGMKKPVVAFIAGRTAPADRRMGHAGAIISGGRGTAGEKMKALAKAGIRVVENPADVGAVMASVLKGQGES